MKDTQRIEIVHWSDVAEKFKSSDANLYDILSDISGIEKFEFITVRYPFGSLIVKNGRLQIMSRSAGLVSLNDPRLDKDIAKLICYTAVPLGLIADENGVEVFRDMEERIYSVATRGKSLDVGIWEHFGLTTPYSVSAGARSLYMVPKITLASGHKRLKADYHVTLPPPKRIYDHWPVFKQIANSKLLKDHWYCEVIYFTKPMIEALQKNEQKKNSTWFNFHYYLVQKFSKHSEYARRKAIFDVIWELFARRLSKEEIRVNPYNMETLKHIVFIVTKAIPGSVPYTGNNALGPLDDVQKAYLDSYGMRDYVPTIMQPRFFSTNVDEPVYYSLQSPTLLQSVPQTKNPTSISDTIRELQELFLQLINASFDNQIKIADVSINEILANLSLEFFHDKKHAYGGIILPTCQLPARDKRLLYVPEKYQKEKMQFAETAAYLHGMVKITNNKKCEEVNDGAFINPEKKLL